MQVLLETDYIGEGMPIMAMTGPEDEQFEEDGDDELLDAAEARRYRAVTARLNYVASDRVDIQYAVKEASRAMSAPRKSHWGMLNKIGRYLKGKPRLVMQFPWQVQQSIITTFTDSDWAGCKRTARSTSGGVVTIGDHVIKSYSKQQKVVALSSAEAELYAMVAASAETLAIQSYARDLGMELQGEVYTDASAALGISQRAGLGKVRHLRTQGLWVQEARVAGRLSYKKILGTKNPADILTKHVGADLLARHLETLGAEFQDGRADAAPGLSSVEVESWVTWLPVDEHWQSEDSSTCRRITPERKITKRVHFDRKVQFRAVPLENHGRKCRNMEVVRFVKGRGAGGVLPDEDADLANVNGEIVANQEAIPRPRWADMADEEDHPTP